MALKYVEISFDPLEPGARDHAIEMAKLKMQRAGVPKYDIRELPVNPRQRTIIAEESAPGSH